MPTSASDANPTAGVDVRADPAPAPSVVFHNILSDDGTRLRAWTNDPDRTIDGPTVVLCNGLGANAFMWPALLDPDCGVRVVSWNHRGTGGSARPRDLSHVEIEHFVEDALSVMDHFGVTRAALIGWSTGVTTMFELATRHPERVLGLFAVAGVPGDKFWAARGPWFRGSLGSHLNHRLARALTAGVFRVGTIAGRAVTPFTTRIPVGRRMIAVLSHSGLMLPVADRELTSAAVAEFLTTPVEWYAHLALGTSRHPGVWLRRIGVPARFISARFDVLAPTRDMATAAEEMANAEHVELRSSHFVQIEQPELVHLLLLDFLEELDVGSLSG